MSKAIENKITLRQWLRLFKEGEFDAADFSTQCDAGWYDWFCQDSSLRNKTYKLAPKVKQIAASPKIDPDEVYVWFKNNCPMSGSLYDDFRIADVETNDTLYTFIPRSGHSVMKGQAELWGKDNDFTEALVVGSWRDVKKYMEV